MKLKLLFDYEIFSKQRAGGISNYFYNLGRELINLNIDTIFFSPLHRNQYLSSLSKKNIIGFDVKYIPFKLNFILDAVNFFFTKKLLKKNIYNLMHQTYYSENNFTNVKKICTVYDLTNEKFPNFFPQSNNITNLKKKTILNSDHIICISDNTKKDLINFFNINPDKIATTLLASDLYCPDVTIKNKKLRNYILFVGSRSSYKNFESLLNAYSSSSFLKNNFKIALFGGERFGENDQKLMKCFNIDYNKIWIIDEKKYRLQYIYSNVAALVYPSIYEGFGLPIVEAMSCGCPVISSLAGSTKEVGGEGIDYFDPLDVSQMKNLIEKLVTSDLLQESKIAYGYKRANLFSWKKCAQETLEVYKKVIAS